MIETSDSSVRDHSETVEMRDDVLGLLKLNIMASDDIAEDEWFKVKWRARYQDDYQYLQDIRRRCSDLSQEGLIEDSGTRRPVGIYGKPVARWQACTPKSAHDSWKPKGYTGDFTSGAGFNAEYWKNKADKYARTLGKISCGDSFEAKLAKEALR